jgi:hypothetical protein
MLTHCNLPFVTLTFIKFTQVGTSRKVIQRTVSLASLKTLSLTVAEQEVTKVSQWYFLFHADN